MYYFAAAAQSKKLGMAKEGSGKFMHDNEERFGILRWINYRETSLEGLERVIQYICNTKSTPPELQEYSCLRIGNPVHDFELIEKRWRKTVKGRLYKHCIFSFGEPELDPAKAFEVMKAVFSIYRGEYPYVLGIHTNVPYRVHGHCVMGMTNLLTGKRFSQSPGELKRFQEFYNQTVVKVGLPPLRSYWLSKKLIQLPSSKTHLSNEYERGIDVECDKTICIIDNQPYAPIGVQNYINGNAEDRFETESVLSMYNYDPMSACVDIFQNDFKAYFSLGYHKRGAFDNE